jgi:hypothetical protein
VKPSAAIQPSVQPGQGKPVASKTGLMGKLTAMLPGKKP